jgi:hypothetical protein
MAVDDCSRRVRVSDRVLSADHQNSPTSGVNRHASGSDTAGGRAVDMSNAGHPLAVAPLVKDKNAWRCSPRDGALTGDACQPDMS